MLLFCTFGEEHQPAPIINTNSSNISLRSKLIIFIVTFAYWSVTTTLWKSNRVWNKKQTKLVRRHSDRLSGVRGPCCRLFDKGLLRLGVSHTWMFCYQGFTIIPSESAQLSDPARLVNSLSMHMYFNKTIKNQKLPCRSSLLPLMHK